MQTTAPAPPASSEDVQYFTANDGTQLAYRHYEPKETAKGCLVLLHGACYNSKKYIMVGTKLANQYGIRTYLIDIRGHGESGNKKGDIDFIGQLEDDLLVVMEAVKAANPETPLYLGGHSGGGSIVLRYVALEKKVEPEGYVLISPFIASATETHQKVDHDQRLFTSYKKRFFFGFLLNELGIKILDHVTTVVFNFPQKLAEQENLVLRYTYNMSRGMNADHYYESLGSIRQPLLMMVGTEDERLKPECVEDLLRWNVKSYIDQTFHYIPKRNHFGILLNLADYTGKWLTQKIEESGSALERIDQDDILYQAQRDAEARKREIQLQEEAQEKLTRSRRRWRYSTLTFFVTSTILGFAVSEYRGIINWFQDMLSWFGL